MVERLLLRSSWRFFTRHPWQLGLTLLSIALGTAVIIAVDLANATAERSFRQSVSTLVGPMSHEITAAEGFMEEGFYPRLRLEMGYRQAVPQLEGRIAVNGLYYTLLGVDPLAYLQLPAGQYPLPVEAVPFELLPRLIAEPGSIVLSRQLGETLQVEAGDQLRARVDGTAVSLTVLAVVDMDDAARRDVILTDIATAQNALNQVGRLSRIQLMLEDAEAQALEASLPPRLQLVSYDTREQGFAQMTEAFRINLTAMSLLAMLVGAFLVYNTMTFSVLQRRQSFAIQRMLGTRGAQLFRHMVLEALSLGVIGSALGVVLGMVLAQGLLGLITQTISDLYVSLEAQALSISPALVAKGIGITLLAVLAATVGPAWEAARVQPVYVHRGSHLEQRRQRHSGVLLVAGLLGFVLSALLLDISRRSLVLGFTGLFVFIMAYSMLIPAILKWSLAGLRRASALGSLNQRLMIRGVEASLSRTALAIIALTVAVSATVGVSVMINSFRASVAHWLDETLSSDIYISARSEQSARSEGLLEPRWLQRVRSLPAVTSVSTGFDTRFEYRGVPVPLLVLQPGRQSARGFEFLGGDPAAVWNAFVNEKTVLISEPLAYHHRLERGQDLKVTIEGKTIEFRIAGVYRDYSASQGMAVMRRELYARHWGEPGYSSIGLMLGEDADSAALKQRLEAWAAQSERPVLVRYNEQIKTYSLEIFDRTFAITDVLRLLVIIVAFVGVFSALMALFLEKRREFAILRATGVTPGRLRMLVLSQAALIGLFAGLLSLPLGFIMSDILIDVINRRSFGWTMQQYFFVGIPLQALVLAIVAAVLAALYPTRRISRSSLHEGLRSE